MKIKLLFLIICLVLISGCYNHIINFNVSTNSQCTLKCAELLKHNFCNSAQPVYSYKSSNDLILNQECECLLINCMFNKTK